MSGTVPSNVPLFPPFVLGRGRQSVLYLHLLKRKAAAPNGIVEPFNARHYIDPAPIAKDVVEPLVP